MSLSIKNLPMWECELCRYVFDKKENQLLKCPKCGGDRIPYKSNPNPNRHYMKLNIPEFENKRQALKFFAKRAGINYIPHKDATDKELGAFAHRVIAPNLPSRWRKEFYKYFTTYFESRFRTGNFDEWTATTVDGDAILEVNKDNPYRGAYNAYAWVTDIQGDNAFCRVTFTTDYTLLYVRFYANIIDAPTGVSDRFYILQIKGLNNIRYLFRLMVRGDGSNPRFRILYRDGGSDVDTGNLQTITLNRYYCLEAKVKMSTAGGGSNGEVEFWIDGSSEFSNNAVDNDDQTSNMDTVITGIVYGWGSGVDGSLQFDYVVIADSYIGTLPFCSGWEDSGGSDLTDNGRWTSSSGTKCSVQSSVTYHGDYAMMLENTDTDNDYSLVNLTLPSEKTELWGRAYIRVNSVGTYYIRNIIQFRDGNANEIFGIGIKTTRYIYARYRDNGVYEDTSSTAQLTLDVWYCLELHCKIHDSDGQIHTYLDGDEVTDITHTGLDNRVAADLKYFRVGANNSWATTRIYYDCVICADAYIGMLPWNDGFEPGDFRQWSSTSGSPTIVGSPVYEGSYAMETTGTGSSYASRFGFSDDVIYVRFYLRTPSSITSTKFVGIGHIDHNASPIWGSIIRMAIKNDGGTWKWAFRWYDGGLQNNGYGTASSQQTPSASTWYCVEMYYSRGASDAEYKMYVDDSELTDISKSGCASDYNIDGIDIGNTYSTEYKVINVDCVVVADEYIGPEEEEEPPAGAEAYFETGDLSEFDNTSTNNGTIAATSDEAHHGTYSCKCDVNGDGNAYAEGYFDIAEQQPVYCRGYFRFNQLPKTNKDYTIISFENTSGPTTVGYIQLIDDNETKKWKMRRITGGGATYSTSTSNIPEADTWVCVEFAHGENLAKLWVDGDELLSHTDATDQTIDRVHIGACSSDIDADDTLEIHIDCIIVTDEYIGPETEIGDLEVNNLTVNEKLLMPCVGYLTSEGIKFYNSIQGAFDEQ